MSGLQVTIRHFEDVSQHAAALDAWSQYYDQLSPGSFHGYLQDLVVPGMRVFRERMSSRIAQHTQAPVGTANILVPLTIPAAYEDTASGTGILCDGLTLLPQGKEFFFCSPPGTDYVVISLALDFLERILVPEDMEYFLRKPRGYGLRCEAGLLQALQRRVMQVLSSGALDEDGSAAEAATQAALHGQIVCLLLERLEAEEGGKQRMRELNNVHPYLVKYCHERVLASDSQVSLLALCHELKVPRRTLHYAFERVVGMSPSNYLRAVRLNAAERCMQDDRYRPVTAIAHQWGFAHASHFGREYKKLFGRTPSVRASALESANAGQL